nr:hypothetical protein [uncultured Lachnoclostridium sp.]
MTGIIAVAGLVIFTVLVSAWNHREGRKWKRARVLSSFGQKPEEGERPSEQTRILWEKTKTENGLDDITWSDLDLDDVFVRVNTCCAWVGPPFSSGIWRCCRPSCSFSSSTCACTR